MTRVEANLVLFLRCHQKATYGYIEGVIRAIYGDEQAELMAHPGPHTLGLRLVTEAEQVRELKPGESDSMTVDEIVCLDCGKPHWSMHYDTDTTKECPHCRKMSCFVNPKGRTV